MSTVEAYFVDTARAKVNLTLRVVGRRADGYHEIESLVAFADIADTLRLQTTGRLALEIGGANAAACGPIANNIIFKAASALAQHVDGLKSGRFILVKELPVAAGLGGGSADAAAALRLLAHANAISFDDPRMLAAALSVGADVPACFESVTRVMRGIGEELSPPLGLPKLPALLVNPGVALPTKDVFAALEPKDYSAKALGEVPRGHAALIEWLGHHGNDLTAPAVACAPVVGEVLSALAALPNCRLARMSGSGATCFALFDSVQDAEAADKRLRVAHERWWICPTTLG